MKRVNYLLCALTIVLLITSCSPIQYQVYEVKAPGMELIKNTLAYENTDVKISYNLWSENGAVRFIVENKTDRNIFIDLGQTFIIKNGFATEYFKDRTYTTTTSINKSNTGAITALGTLFYFGNIYDVSVGKSVETSKGLGYSVTHKEKKYECIPAHSMKDFYQYDIEPNLEIACNKEVDIPKTSSLVKEYTAETTPMKIVNRVAYSFTEGDKNIVNVDNVFWISKIKNYAKKSAIEKVSVQDGCKSSVKKSVFKIGCPNMFYKTVKKNNVLQQFSTPSSW